MKITLLGATGNAGTRIQNELLTRGHQVTAVTRDPSKVAPAAGLSVVQGDLTMADIAAIIAGADVVVNSYGPPAASPYEIVDVTRRLIFAVKKAGVPRFLMVGGAGSLEVAPGVQLVDTPTFPDAWKGIAEAHREALKVLEGSDINWTYLSPGAFFAPGDRTGKFRLGINELIRNDAGESKISMEDYAIALADEIENPKHPHQRFSIGY